ncbi:hypothetical protein M8C21_009627, partial [Ambrosia artemisiifolia]
IHLQGLKTAIIEEDVVGGKCVNRCCVPSKVILAVSGRMRDLQNEHHMKSFGLQETPEDGDRHDPNFVFRLWLIIDPLSEYAFCSKKDVLRYLEPGDVKNCASRPLKSHMNNGDTVHYPVEAKDAPFSQTIDHIREIQGQYLAGVVQDGVSIATCGAKDSVIKLWDTRILKAVISQVYSQDKPLGKWV